MADNIMKSIMNLHKLAACVVAVPVAAICLGLPNDSAAAVQKVFYVSPSGSDENPGTEEKPLKTIEKARDAVRAIDGEMTGDIEVVLRGGTYRIDHTLVFDHRDSGTIADFRRGFLTVFPCCPHTLRVRCPRRASGSARDWPVACRS